MFFEVGMFKSPKWNGNIRFPFEPHSAAACETANAVSVPKFAKRVANAMTKSPLFSVNPCTLSANKADCDFENFIE